MSTKPEYMNITRLLKNAVMTYMNNSSFVSERIEIKREQSITFLKN